MIVQNIYVDDDDMGQKQWFIMVYRLSINIKLLSMLFFSPFIVDIFGYAMISHIFGHSHTIKPCQSWRGVFLSEKESKHIKQLVKMIEHIYKIEKYPESSTGSPFTQPRLLPYLELKPLQKRQTVATNLRHCAWWTVERSCFQCFGKILGERHCGLGSHHILFGCCILKNLNINASAKTIGRW